MPKRNVSRREMQRKAFTTLMMIILHQYLVTVTHLAYNNTKQARTWSSVQGLG